MGFMKHYTGNYLKAAQLDGPVVATIDHGEEAELKPLILNKTNAGRLEEIARSDDPTALKGLAVELYVEPVNFQGQMLDAVRVRAPSVPF